MLCWVFLSVRISNIATNIYLLWRKKNINLYTLNVNDLNEFTPLSEHHSPHYSYMLTVLGDKRESINGSREQGTNTCTNNSPGCVLLVLTVYIHIFGGKTQIENAKTKKERRDFFYIQRQFIIIIDK